MTSPRRNRSRPPLGFEVCERRAMLSGSGLLPEYDTGAADAVDIWVDPVSGHDALSGATRLEAVRSVSEAWRRVPVGSLSVGVRINLVAGTYPQSGVPHFWESRHGSFTAPVIVRAADGAGTARLPSLNIYDCRHLHLLGLEIRAGGGDVVQIQASSHVLLRDTTIRGDGDIASYAVPQEALKVNQSQHIFIERCDISGAWDNAVDFVAVQYGHVVGSRIHRAGDWAMYAKGGSAHLTITGNEFFDAGTGGFTAGQGTGFEFMVAPWLHYEAYDIAFTNNVVRDVQGAGMGVNGGFNILLAHNTLVNVGTRSHAIEVVHGLRSCDGDVAACRANLLLGGWGTAVVGREESIPNKNVVIVNNLVFNPDGVASRWQHFAVAADRSPPAGTNIPSPTRADDGLVIRGNLVWNGPPGLDLGIADATLAAEVLARNQINTGPRPILVDPAGGDYRFAASFTPPAAVPVPAFTWSDAPATPALPAGRTDLSVGFDHAGAPRQGPQVPGAFAPPPAELVVDVAAGQVAGLPVAAGEATRIVKRGPGVLILDRANTHSGGTVVEAGELVIRDPAALGTGTLNVHPGAKVALDLGPQPVPVARLDLAPTATLDVGSGAILVAEPGDLDASGRFAVVAKIARNLGNPGGTGPGIMSSGIEPGNFREIGHRLLPDGSLRVGYAAVGDANMDGTVSVQDLVALNAGGKYGMPATDAGWWQGDFNFDGRVDVTDLVALLSSGLYGTGSYLPLASGGTADAPPRSPGLRPVAQSVWFAAAGWGEPDAALPERVGGARLARRIRSP